MNQQEINVLASDQKFYAAPFYYRLRQKAEQYEIARLVAGPCGDFTYHPKITFTVTAEQMQAIAYFDNHQTPIKQVTAIEDRKFVEQELSLLWEIFLQVYPQ